ncbi:YezD family protein [Alteraurantiacibacter palmitatis]|uniref:YezD family protein n=1 Tax=Alteraurantiacibacter palmitatis TaxID=2054628 RepID=A0ABV7E4M1_9SPHN
MSKTSEHGPAPAQDERPDGPLGLVASVVERIRFGAVQLTIHDGRITHVDVTERRRFGA